MATVTKPIALDESFNTTEVTPRNIADVLAEELSHITGRTASEVEYDNTDSGLTADNVQDALDEIAESVPTLPTTDIQTAVDEFETYNGGLLSSCKVALSPNQDLHGYENPWVGGAGANKWDEEWRNGYYQLDTQASNYGQFVSFAGAVANKNPISVLPSTNYTMCVVSGGSGSIFFYDSNHDVISHTLFYVSPFSFTTPANCAYINFNMNASPYGATYKNDIALNYPSTVTTYSSYSNICPISGHTQVDVDVSDGQTTQEQVTVNLGGTYYSGTLEAVSGVLTVDEVGVSMDGSESWNTHGAISHGFYCDNVIPSGLLMDSTKDDTAISNEYNQNRYDVATSMDNGKFAYGLTGGTVRRFILRDDRFSTVADLTTALGTTNLQLVMELATPTPIQLSPTMVKALVGENHLSAPLDGQEITESKYKQMFTFDDVNAQIESTYSEGISHNSVYRGKYLGDHVTDEQWDAIGDGSFRDLYIGDYWTINGINWRIAHFNYWLGTGDVKCNTNHVVIVPYGWVSTFNMNASDDTTGGYLNSEWYTTNRHFAVENIEADFGASHILSHRNFFSDAVSDGHASHGVWVDSTVDLMNEIMVCGSLVGSYSGKYYEVGCDKFQLALFKYNPPSARMDVSYWLRGVSTASSFVAMGNFGLLDGFTASQILKIRPVFAIKK